MPTNPRPPGKSWNAKAPGWGQIFGANLRGCAGGLVMDEIDTCIRRQYSQKKDLAVKRRINQLQIQVKEELKVESLVS